MWRAPRNWTGKARDVLLAQSRACTKTSEAPQKNVSHSTTEASKQASPPPPPSPPSSGGGGGGVFSKLLGLTIIGAGGAVGYAWYDAEFRKTLESNVPYSKEAFDTIFQYLPAHQEQAKRLDDIVALPPAQPVHKPTEEPRGLAHPIIVDTPKAPMQPKLQPPPVPELRSPVELKKEAAEEKKRQEKERVQRALQEKQAEEAAENAALEQIVSSVIGEAVELVQHAIDAQKAAAQAMRAHSLQLKVAMDESDKKANKDVQWKSVAVAHEAKLDATLTAEELQLRAQETLEKLKLAIKDGKGSAITKKNKVLLGAEQTFHQIHYDLQAATAELAKATSEAKVMKDYQDLVKKGKQQFKKELEAIMPDVKLGKRFGGRLTEEELNSLIAHAHRRIEQLQRQLAEQQALEQLRTSGALEAQQGEDDKLAKRKVALEGERLRAQFDMEKQNLETEAGVKFEQELRHELARQAAAHSEHLQTVLGQQDQELHKKYTLLFAEKLVEESDKIRCEVQDSITRLKGIEAALDGRAEMEKQGRKAQELWLACQTLYNIILFGKQNDEAETYEENQKALSDEVAAIKAAGNHHPFVNTVLDAMPKEALTSGVYTEEAMSERFSQVRRVCRRVAMIDETSSTLFRYFLSFVQSFLVFSKNQPLAMDQEVNLEELDTFKILDNASFCMERGDYVQALRYMNQLHGEARCVAADWIADMRCLLETKQAADALLAHASAAGLGALF